jgi:putative PIN family toxin of toxin-antitoxin system
MLNAVVDSTVLVSAFLRSQGAAAAVLLRGVMGVFTCWLALDIITETQRARHYPHIRERYSYTDEEIEAYGVYLQGTFPMATDLPPLTGIVRDPNDDVIVACAVAAHASHIVTRDRDLLSLGAYKDITILTPEAFLTLLREREASDAR